MSDVYLTPEMQHKLREPFPAEFVGKLPRVTCGRCRDSRDKSCDQHAKSRCNQCHNWITSAHMHLDYVGHAETTDRLLSVDPLWTWSPLAIDDDGLPAYDKNGGLWINLTVGGVTRLGYGSANGKQGPDAIKEIIGDALRNAAMRFGVAIDLWGAKFKDPDDDQTAPTAAPAGNHVRLGHRPEDVAVVAEADRMDGELQKTKATHNAVRSLRSRIAEHEQAKGKDIQQIAAEFALFTGNGADISKAKGPELQKYLRHIGVPLVEGDEEWQVAP